MSERLTLTLEQIETIEGNARKVDQSDMVTIDWFVAQDILALCAMARASLRDTSTAREGDLMALTVKAINAEARAIDAEQEVEELRKALSEIANGSRAMARRLAHAALAPSDPVSAGRDAQVEMCRKVQAEWKEGKNHE
ncbi:hypothetical protein MHZ93_04045 [Roseomonas sp. ACRSG]|nr:hypothetical protein [Roseomonas sp. ACRSG]